MLIICVRTVILYLLLLVGLRLMGKRQLGEMEPAEFVVAMLLADLAAVPMQDKEIPLSAGIIPIVTVVCIQFLLSLASLKWVSFRRLLCGKPVILIGEGKIQVKNLRRARITLDELTEHLREKDVLELSQVQYAILETNGQISVFPFPQYQPPGAEELGCAVSPRYLPVTLVSDGKLQKKNLKICGRNEVWVNRVLKERKCTLENTLLLTVDQGGQICLIQRENEK